MKTAKLLFTCFAMLIVLAACGGGGEPLTNTITNPDPAPGSGEDALTIRMSIVDSDNLPSTMLREGSPLNVNVQVTNSSGAGVSGQVVSYTLSQPSLANFNNDTATALTNSEGIASIQLTVGISSGSGTVTASLVDSVAVTGGFESGGTQQETPASLELFANAVQLASSGGDEIELIAVVKNEQNILLPNIDVSFSVNNGASLSDIDDATGDDGTARATLSTINNKENRTITVLASTGGLAPETLDIRVVGTEVNINGAGSVILNDSAPITIVLSDSDGNGIAGQEVNLTVDRGELDNESPTTGENGQVTVQYTASEVGMATIQASALSAFGNYEISIQEDDFSFVSLPTEGLDLAPTRYPLTLRWNRNGTPFANANVTINTSRGKIDTAANLNENTVTTDANGEANFIISSEFAGPATLSAIGVDGSDQEVTARGFVEFIAETVDTIFVDATPDLIGPEGQTSTITAMLRDEKGNLIKGKTVNFSLVTDASGGSISPNTANTDSNGIASTVYTSNAVSGDNGVVIEAASNNVDENGFVLETITEQTSLTVGDRAFDISLGTGSDIQIPDNSSYLKEFSVFVTDSSGRPVADAELTASITPTDANAYIKGSWQWDPDASIYFSVETAYCVSEDANRDGRLEQSEDQNQNDILDEGEDLNENGTLDRNEDLNNDGQLTPGNVASIAFSGNVARTNDFGQATLEVRYPKQFGAWSTVKIRVFGQSAGTESMQSQDYRLEVAADDLTRRASPPQASPFGISANCADTL